jgi:hypothetical protein
MPYYAAAAAISAALTILLVSIVIGYGPLLPLALYVCLGRSSRTRRLAWAGATLALAALLGSILASVDSIWAAAFYAMPVAMLWGSLVALRQFQVVFTRRRQPAATPRPPIRVSLSGLFTLTALVAVSLALHQALRRRLSGPIESDLFDFAIIVSLLALATTFAALWVTFGAGRVVRWLVAPLCISIAVVALMLIYPMSDALGVFVLTQTGTVLVTLLVLRACGFRLTVDDLRSQATSPG